MTPNALHATVASVASLPWTPVPFQAGTLGTVRYGFVAFLVVVGVFFLTVGTVGLLRLPNVYNRMHATSKATTLGAASVFLGGLVYYGPQGAGLVCLVGIVFLYVTAPTGAHMISRAAGKMGVPFEPGVVWPVEPGDEDDAIARSREGDAGDDS